MARSETVISLSDNEDQGERRLLVCSEHLPAPSHLPTSLYLLPLPFVAAASLSNKGYEGLLRSFSSVRFFTALTLIFILLGLDDHLSVTFMSLLSPFI